MRFEIPGEPKGKGRPRLGKGFTYTPKDTVNYENWVKTCYITQDGGMLQGPIYAKINCFYGIPKSTPRKKVLDMECGHILPTKKPDLDNIAKIILDSLNGIAYKDDSQVVELTITKHYAVKPSVVVELKEEV